MCKMWLDFLVSWLNLPVTVRPAQGWTMQLALTACYPAADWDPPTTGTTNHGQAQTLLRQRLCKRNPTKSMKAATFMVRD